MDLHQKIRTLPTAPGVYLYKNAEGQIIYVGKAKNLRSRVGSYFVRGADENAKTGSLLREAVDVEYIVVGTKKKLWRLKTTLSSRSSRATTSSCATTRPIPTSSSPWASAIRAFMSPGD